MKGSSLLQTFFDGLKSGKHFPSATNLLQEISDLRYCSCNGLIANPHVIVVEHSVVSSEEGGTEQDINNRLENLNSSAVLKTLKSDALSRSPRSNS